MSNALSCHKPLRIEAICQMFFAVKWPTDQSDCVHSWALTNSCKQEPGFSGVQVLNHGPNLYGDDTHLLLGTGCGLH